MSPSAGFLFFFWGSESATDQEAGLVLSIAPFLHVAVAVAVAVHHNPSLLGCPLRGSG